MAAKHLLNCVMRKSTNLASALVFLLMALSSFGYSQAYQKTEIIADSTFLSPPFSIHAANDSGYLIGSQGYYQGQAYDAMTRVDGKGQAKWTHLFRSDTATNYFGMRASSTADGAWASYVSWFGSSGHIFVNKVNDQGQKHWTQSFWFGTNSNFDDIVGGTDSSIYLIGGGCTSGASAVVKISPAGQPLWYRSYQSVSGGARRALINEAGNLMVIGQAQNENLTFLELDNSGTALNSVRIPMGEVVVAQDLIEYKESNQNNYLLTAYLYRNNNNVPRRITLLVALDSVGQVLWSDTLSNPDYDYGPTGALQNKNGDLLVYGSTNEYGGYNGRTNGFLARWSSQGQYIDTRVIGDSLTYTTYEDGNLNSKGDLLIVETHFGNSPLLNQISGSLDSICGVQVSYPRVGSLQLSSVNDFAVFNYTISERPHSFSNHLLSASTQSLCGGLLLQRQSPAQSIRLYPNPADRYVQIEAAEKGRLQIQLRDLQGRICLNKPLGPAERRIQLNELSKGLYFYQVFREGMLIDSGKLLLQGT